MMSQGDPSLILNYCKDYWDGASITPLVDEDRREILNVYHRWAIEDFDVVGFAYSPVPSRLQPLIKKAYQGIQGTVESMDDTTSNTQTRSSKSKRRSNGSIRGVTSGGYGRVNSTNCLFFVDPRTVQELRHGGDGVNVSAITPVTGTKATVSSTTDRMKLTVDVALANGDTYEGTNDLGDPSSSSNQATNTSTGSVKSGKANVPLSPVVEAREGEEDTPSNTPGPSPSHKGKSKASHEKKKKKDAKPVPLLVNTTTSDARNNTDRDGSDIKSAITLPRSVSDSDMKLRHVDFTIDTFNGKLDPIATPRNTVNGEESKTTSSDDTEQTSSVTPSTSMGYLTPMGSMTPGELTPVMGSHVSLNELSYQLATNTLEEELYDLPSRAADPSSSSRYSAHNKDEEDDEDDDDDDDDGGGQDGDSDINSMLGRDDRLGGERDSGYLSTSQKERRDSRETSSTGFSVRDMPSGISHKTGSDDTDKLQLRDPQHTNQRQESSHGNDGEHEESVESASNFSDVYTIPPIPLDKTVSLDTGLNTLNAMEDLGGDVVSISDLSLTLPLERNDPPGDDQENYGSSAHNHNDMDRSSTETRSRLGSTLDSTSSSTHQSQLMSSTTTTATMNGSPKSPMSRDSQDSIGHSSSSYSIDTHSSSMASLYTINHSRSSMVTSATSSADKEDKHLLNDKHVHHTVDRIGKKHRQDDGHGGLELVTRNSEDKTTRRKSRERDVDIMDRDRSRSRRRLTSEEMVAEAGRKTARRITKSLGASLWPLLRQQTFLGMAASSVRISFYSFCYSLTTTAMMMMSILT